MNLGLKIDLINELKEFKRENTISIYNGVNQFRTKISLLINNTPTGDLRNELSEINILVENLVKDYEERFKIIQNL